MSVGERYARFLVGHAWAIVIAVMVATAGLVAGLGRLHAEFDLEASLPANHPFVRIDHQIRRDFGGRNTMIVAIVPREGDVWRPEVLEVVQDVTLAALQLPDVIVPNVVSLAAPSVRHVEEVEFGWGPIGWIHDLALQRWWQASVAKEVSEIARLMREGERGKGLAAL